jgi:GAF domain-containing protein
MPGTSAASPRPATDRLHGLLDAHGIVTSDLSLQAMLSRIVQQACDLVGARYGALGVFGTDRGLEQFVHYGMDPATVENIGTLPKGLGLLAAMVDDPRPIRLTDLSADHRAVGFPAGHPPMRALLRVPVVVRGEVYGSLYLTEPAVGEFSAEDEKLVIAFAALAATAIANARLYEDARRNRDWLNASGEIARALLAGGDVDALMDVVSRALDVAEADYGGLILPTEDGRLRVMVTVGVGADYFHGHVFDPAKSPMGHAIVSGRSVVMPDMTTLANEDFVNVYNYGPLMLAPLVDAHGVRGAVLLMRTVDRVPFHQRDLDSATTFADQVAFALQLNDARADAEMVHVLEDRQRIGDDLHDNVIQRLFATGVGLQRLADRGLPPDDADTLRRHISDLDETIAQVRERVFGLRSGVADSRPHRRFPRVAVPKSAE